MKYKVGDKVKIREWDDMVDEFGLNDDGDIPCLQTFVTNMTKYCGTIMTIKENEYGYYLMDDDKDAWSWSDDMIEGLAQESDGDIMSSNGKLNKGIDSKMVQDYYRAVVDERGNVKFNHIKMVNVCFVKHDGNSKIYAFENPSDKRLPEGTKVRVMTSKGASDGVVVSSIKIQKKYLKELTCAVSGKRCGTLQPVLGVYKEVKELIKLGCDD